MCVIRESCDGANPCRVSFVCVAQMTEKKRERPLGVAYEKLLAELQLSDVRHVFCHETPAALVSYLGSPLVILLCQANCSVGLGSHARVVVTQD